MNFYDYYTYRHFRARCIELRKMHRDHRPAGDLHRSMDERFIAAGWKGGSVYFSKGNWRAILSHGTPHIYRENAVTNLITF
jgi:hypothetical protein